MISIIICSKQATIEKALSENIKCTIGNVPFEIICIDNSQNKHSIFSAYNEGVKRAKYEYLLFIHEDVIFHTRDWSNSIKTKFELNPEVGMLGIVGSHFLTYDALAWFSCNKKRGQYIQGRGKGKKYSTWSVNYNEKNDQDPYVVSIDGFWMCIRKELFKKDLVQWDEKTYYDGFNFYDLDMSMQIIASGYKICILDDIEVEHKSMGNFDKKYYRCALPFHRKWNHLLPVCSPSITKSDLDAWGLIHFEDYFIKMTDNPYRVINYLYRRFKKN